jgi:hypothetical protein
MHPKMTMQSQDGVVVIGVNYFGPTVFIRKAAGSDIRRNQRMAFCRESLDFTRNFL